MLIQINPAFSLRGNGIPVVVTWRPRKKLDFIACCSTNRWGNGSYSKAALKEGRRWSKGFRGVLSARGREGRLAKVEVVSNLKRDNEGNAVT